MLKKTYLLALFSAFILWLAWPPNNWLAPLLLFGLVPLFVALEEIISKKEKKTGKRVFLTAGLTFLVWNTASIYWVYNAISADNTAIIALLISLIPFGLGALLMTFSFWLYFQLRTKVNSNISYLGLICTYISMEYLHQSWDLAFPWMTLGNGFATTHQLVQWYEYTGVYGGSLWILISNILAFETYKAWRQKKPLLAPTASWLLITLFPIAFSLFIYFQYKEKSIPANVVVVQPNIDPYEKFGHIPSNTQIQILTDLSDSVAQVNTEYFIWPETAITHRSDEADVRSNPGYLQSQQFLNKYKNATIISGIESYKIYPNQATLSAQLDKRSGRYFDSFNAAIQIENSAQVAFYHKSKLVPGVEKMPFPKVLSFLAPVFQHLGGSPSGYGWQDSPGVFYAQSGIGVAPVICYESIWGNWVGESVKNGAQFIAIITNDGWWGNTSGKDQHLLYAKLRAVETRRWVVRSANTGISGFINQRGDIVKRSKWWTRDALKADINLNDNMTFYVHYGDIIAQIAVVLAILLSLIIPYKKWFHFDSRKTLKQK